MLSKKGVLVFLVLLIGYYFIHLFTGFAISCPIHYLTGYYCPGCGITRMLFSIIKLDFYQAFRYNPLVFVMLIIYVAINIIEAVFKFNIKIPEIVLNSLIGILIIYGILRNMEMFSYLKPTIIH